MITSRREQILAKTTRHFILAGVILAAAYVVPIVFSDLSNFLGRLDLLGWMSDLAMLLSLPWEVLATVLIVVRWRDLPQRFWILYCANGILAYLSVPIYRMHFGLYR